MKRIFKLFSLTIVFAFLVTLMGMSATPAYATSSVTFTPVSPPLPSGQSNGELLGVWGSSASNVYAVGYAGSEPLIDYYDGSWTASSPSLPSGWTSGQLTGVWGSDADNVYAVGNGNNGTTTEPLVYYYNGSGWTSSGLTLPSGWTSGQLTGVWSSGAGNVYAIGKGANSSGDLMPLLYKYNGNWANLSLTLPSGLTQGWLNGVWGSSFGNVYAVGGGDTGTAYVPLLYHNAGSGWTNASPNPIDGWGDDVLQGVWGSSASNIYAAGWGNNGMTDLPTVRQNSASGGWTLAYPSMSNGDNWGSLQGVWGSSSSDVYAVGYENSGISVAPLIYQNNGNGVGWLPFSPSLPSGWTQGYLYGVWGSSASDVYAVGYGYKSGKDGAFPLIYHGSYGTPSAAVFRPSNGTWYIQGTGATSYGTNGDIPVPADYNGDSTTELAVFRPSNGYWYIKGVGATQYGTNGDIPIPADYNGDGKAELAVFRPSNGTWYIKGVGATQYGTNGDIPVPADYNGDGKAELAVFRPSNGTWYIKGVGTYVYGTNGDIPVPADYNGDGKVELVVFRPSNGTWYIKGVGSFAYGTNGDIPVPMDYNSDGTTELAVFRPSNGTWYIKGVGSFAYGTNGDIPVPNYYNGK